MDTRMECADSDTYEECLVGPNSFYEVDAVVEEIAASVDAAGVDAAVDASANK